MRQSKSILSDPNRHAGRLPGNLLLRKLLPSLISLPVIIILLLIYGVKKGYIEQDAAIICFLVLYIFFSSLIVMITSRSINEFYRKQNEEMGKAEKSAEAERKLFNDVLELLPVYIILLTPDYRVSYANRFFRERFGDSRQKRCYEYLFNRSEPCEICETYKVIREERALTWEWTGPDKHIYSIFDFPFTAADGTTLIMEMGVDVTSLKEAQAELKRLNTGLEERVAARTNELKKSSERLKILSETSSRLLESGNLQELITELCNKVMKFLDCQVFFNYLVDEESGKLNLNSSAGITDETAIRLKTLDLEKSVCGYVANTGKRIIAEDIQDTDDERTSLIKTFGMNAYACLPLLSDDMVLGTLSFGTNTRSKFTDGDISLMKTVSDEVAIALRRVRYEDALRKSEEKYRLLFESMTEGFALHEIITDNNGNPCNYRFISINPAFEKQTGLKACDLVGKMVTEALPGTEIYWIDLYGKVALTGESIEFENYHAGLDKYFRVSAFSPNKGFFAAIFENITDRVIAEKDLRISSEKLNMALQNGKIGTWIWDIEKDKIEWDERMEMIFGFEPGSFNGTYPEFEKCLAEEDLMHVRKAINDVLNHDVPYEIVYRIVKNGSISHISSKASVIKGLDGEPVKLSGVCFDITDMKKGAEKALFKLNEDLLRSNRELEQFAHVASHDLQEPLRMVSSYTQLLELRYQDKLDSDARDFIKFAVDGTVRMQNLINDLLGFSKIETKGGKFQPVDINDPLEDALNNLKFIINEKNALITHTRLPTLIVDRSQIVMLFQNLLANAIKFSRNTPRIDVSAKEEDDHFVFLVKDNGIGIDPQYFNKIFRIFQRLHHKDQYEGTGMGLAICKRIVERHEGKIWVDSVLNKGSKFFFTIPKNNIKTTYRKL